MHVLIFLFPNFSAKSFTISNFIIIAVISSLYPISFKKTLDSRRRYSAYILQRIWRGLQGSSFQSMDQTGSLIQDVCGFGRPGIIG